MINIYSQSGQVTYGIIYYTVDTENEKNSLPTKDKMGSKCYVIESETWYILNGNGEWVPFVGEDSTADAILISIKNMSAEQKDQLKEELNIEDGGGEDFSASFITLIPTNVDVFKGGTWTSDKTFTELLSAFNSGVTIQVKINNVGFEEAQLLVYQNKGNILYAHIRFYDGDQINGEFKIYQNGTYSYENSSLRANDIITVTEHMDDAQKSQTRDNLGAMSMGEMENAIADTVALQKALMTVDGGNLVLNLERWGGIEGFVNAYSNGLNVIFALPMQYLDQAEDDDAVLAMQPMGFVPDSGVFHFEGVLGGKCYYARMTPISENVLSGPLVIRDELPQVTTADNGSILQVANGSWTSATLPSTESLKLTATPTAGPSETTLMSGTWSGATWEEVAAAIQASRLIQLDVAGIGPVTLLYNLGSSTTNASSVAFVYNVGGTLYNVFAEAGSNNQFKLSIINARTRTVNISGTVLTFAPEASNIYKCGELTSLTISNPPATGAYSIVFTSGSTATTTTIPSTILGLEDFAAEANTLYEINVLDNRAVVGSWGVSE